MAPQAGTTAVPPLAEPGASVADYLFALGDEEGYNLHFREQGFVVVHDVLDCERVDATICELWEHPSLLGGYPELQRDDPETWGGDDWPAGCRNFLECLDPCAEVESWRNRIHPAVVRVFEVLWQGLRRDGETSAEGPAVSSVDRFGVMRPTLVPPRPGGGAAWAERPEWRTSRNWLHWDQNPWATPGFFALQGLVMLTEGTATSGGFVTVPGFHRELPRWAEEHPEGTVLKCSRSTPPPITVPPKDEMQGRRVKVLVPRGALLIWDSRMPHENFPNRDESWRLCQYITHKRLDDAGLRLRSEAWHACLRTGLVPASFARRFSASEQALLGMAAREEDVATLRHALEEGEGLAPEAVDAARQLKRAYRLMQTAMAPSELLEAKELFRAAFATNPALREPLGRVAAAEAPDGAGVGFLPFWIL